jgi:hypothetical protein
VVEGNETSRYIHFDSLNSLNIPGYQAKLPSGINSVNRLHGRIGTPKSSTGAQAHVAVHLSQPSNAGHIQSSPAATPLSL